MEVRTIKSLEDLQALVEAMKSHPSDNNPFSLIRQGTIDGYEVIQGPDGRLALNFIGEVKSFVPPVYLAWTQGADIIVFPEVMRKQAAPKKRATRRAKKEVPRENV